MTVCYSIKRLPLWGKNENACIYSDIGLAGVEDSGYIHLTFIRRFALHALAFSESLDCKTLYYPFIITSLYLIFSN